MSAPRNVVTVRWPERGVWKAQEPNPRDWTVVRLDGYIACNGCGGRAQRTFRWNGDRGTFLALCDGGCQVTEPGWEQVNGDGP